MQIAKRSHGKLVALVTVLALLIASVCAVTVGKSTNVVNAQTYGYEENFNFTLTTSADGEQSYKVAIKPAVRPNIKMIVIPEEYNGLPVTEIANNGFMSCAKLERAVLPQTLKTLGSNAFSNCAKLEHIVMPNVTNIGTNAFGMCTSLDRLFLPYTVQTVGANILRNNANTVYVQKSVAETAQWSSTWSDYFTGEIVYGAEPTDVALYREIVNAEGNVIGYEIAENQGLTAIEQDVVVYTSFRADGATEYLPVLNICPEAFTFSYAKSITIKDRHADDPTAPEFNHKINVRSNAFLGACVDEVVFDVEATFDHPEGLQVGLTESLFDGTPIEGDGNGNSTRVFELASIQAITLPSNLTVIPDNMFRYCSYLTTIKVAGQQYDGKNVLPNVSEIGDTAFDTVSALENIYIPSTVEKMGMSVFNDWGTSGLDQSIQIDRYEDDIPAGWSANWADGIQSQAAVSFKALTDIVIDLQGGKGGALTIGVRNGGNMPAIEMPQRDGYIFKGIYSQPNGQGLQYYTSDLQSARTWDGTMTLYVNWEQTGYAVTLDDGTNTQTVNAIFGQAMPAANKPKRDGYSFEGFYIVEEDGTRTYYYNADMGSVRDWDRAEPTTLNAEWKTVEYTITYANLKGGSNSASNPTTYTVESEDITFINPADRKGYTGAWDIPSIEKGSWGDKTITAVWTAIEYRISYSNLRGGTNPDTNPEIYTIESEDIVFAVPTGRLGYDGAWNIPSIQTGSTGHVEVLAEWTPIVYTITYDNLLDGVNPSTNKTEFTIEDAMITFAAPCDRDGYTGAWDTERIPAGSIGNRVVTAIWTPIVYTITYVIDEDYINPNVSITEYTIESEDIVFVNPTDRQGYAGSWDIGSIPKGSWGNKTINSVWTLITYTIQYTNLLDGTNPPSNPTEYTIEDLPIIFAPPVGRNGYIGSWDPSGIGSGRTGNITVAAVWTPIVYTIRYENLLDGSNPNSNPLEYTIESGTIIFENPTRLGYEGKWVPASIPAGSWGNVTVVAVWTPIQYAITYEMELGGVNPNADVIFNDDDFEKIKTEKDNTISIEQFINLNEIDPVFFEKSYYAVPLAGADTAYALLLEAMKKYGKVGIARTVLNNKEHIIAIRAKNDALILSTLYFHDEVQRNPVELNLQRKLNDVEIEMAGKLLTLMEKPFEPEKLRDEYQVRLRAAIEQKLQNKEIVASPKQPVNHVGNLMEALQQSLQRMEQPIIPKLNNTGNYSNLPQ